MNNINLTKSKSWSLGKNSINDIRIKSKYKFSDIFCENSLVNNQRVRKIILQQNLLPYKCQGENCCIENLWLNKPIILEIDHKNGINNDNRIENLRFLCPNCHSQTTTFRKAKNKSDYKRKNITDKQILEKIKEGVNNHQIISFFNISLANYKRINLIREKQEKQQNLKCFKCNKNVKTKSKSGLCITCSKKSKRKIDRPSLSDLELNVKEIGFSATGRKYGVSDNAIRKWINQYKNAGVAEVVF